MPRRAVVVGGGSAGPATAARLAAEGWNVTVFEARDVVGGRATRRWSPKHDNILWYAKNPNDYTFRFDEIDRIPYMAPGLVGPEKAQRGKTPTDTWWHTIVSPTGAEKTGYPTQKPLGIINRIVNVHSNPGDRLLDFFAGSGTFGAAALQHCHP